LALDTKSQKNVLAPIVDEYRHNPSSDLANPCADRARTGETARAGTCDTAFVPFFQATSEILASLGMGKKISRGGAERRAGAEIKENQPRRR
jgi:hypothetical protein